MKSLFENEEPKLIEKVWWKIQNFFDDWIYPGYCLKNILFHNYNKIKLPMFKPYEYSDVSDRMKFAIFELIKEYIEKDKPEEHIKWYPDKNLKDDDGLKYGDHDEDVLIPRLKGKYIMDIIKEIYKFYTKDLPEMENDRDYLLTIWNEYIYRAHLEHISGSGDDSIFKIVRDPINVTLEQINDKINWNIVLKYIEKKEDLLKEDIIKNAKSNLDKLIREQIQFYLHLAIEVRLYLWT